MQEWEQELACLVTNIDDLRRYLNITKEEEATIDENCSLKITPHLLHQMKYNDKNGKIKKQFIPYKQIMSSQTGFDDDFLCEKKNEIRENLVIRYPHKAILLVTNECPTYCQFCTRKRIVGKSEYKNNLESAFKYLNEHAEIYDVVITGGDPLLLRDDELEYVFQKITEIKSVKFVRLNTRMPVTIPKRITKELIGILKKYNINYINIHFEHPDEISEETADACFRLANNGIMLGSQSVLLNNINNDRKTLKELFLKLLSIKVKPYYLYQCDRITGCQQFYVSPLEGINLINSVAPEIPGLAVPRFVIDAPDKMGKITVAPNGIVELEENNLILKNFQNNDIYNYEV